MRSFHYPMIQLRVSIASLVVLACVLCLSVPVSSQNEVVVYVSQDRTVAEPILRSFEGDLGVPITAVYDSEEAGGTNLVDRLIQEKGQPKADVFWASDPLQQIQLKEAGILEAYPSVNGQSVRYPHKDLESYWFGFAARVVVIVLNRTRFEGAKFTERPRSILDFMDPKWKGLGAIAEPLFGTTGLYAGVLFQQWGDSRTSQFFEGIKKNKVYIAEDPLELLSRLSRGDSYFCLIDSGEANRAVKASKDLEIVYPDQKPNELGTVIIPNTVSLIRGGPNHFNGKRLIDYLLDTTTESKLAFSDYAYMPLRGFVATPSEFWSLDKAVSVFADFDEVAKKFQANRSFLASWAQSK